jgi:hypothetical protein
LIKFADLHPNSAQVAVEGLQSEAIVDDGTLHINAKIVSVDHLAAVGSRHLGVGQRSKIDP